jgi:hypothetical protein
MLLACIIWVRELSIKHTRRKKLGESLVPVNIMDINGMDTLDAMPVDVV